MTSRGVFRIQHLDGLRGVAISAVVLFHAYSRWSSHLPWSTPRLTSTFSCGWLGVELFFAISGFVIFGTLDRCSTLTEFALKRWLRLFPGMLLASAFIYVMSFFLFRPEGGITLVNAIPGLLFAGPAFWTKLLGAEIKSLDGAFWSIYVEVAFYMVAGIAYFKLKDRYGVGVLVMFLAYLVCRFLSGHSVGSGIPGIVYENLKDIGAENYAWFLVGIYYYRYWKRELKSGLILAIGAGVLGALVIFSNKGKPAAFGSLFVLVIFILSFNLQVLSGLLRNRVILWMGFISYPLYLVHQNFVVGASVWLSQLAPGIPRFMYPLPPIAICLLVAFAFAKLEPEIKGLFAKAPGSPVIRED